MSAFLADSDRVADLLDVFGTYDGNVIFRGLTEGVGGQPAVLGRIGWIFTAFGALLVLWGFVLRSRGAGHEDRADEIVKTWIVIAFMIGGPFLMRAAMEAADSVYDSTVGGPRNLATVCVKAAYAMPELTGLFDSLRNDALARQSGASQATARQALVASAEDGSVLGYLEAFGVSVWDGASDVAAEARQTWTGIARMAALASGFGSAMLKCLLIAATIGPLYLLLLVAAAVAWFMEQLRYFFAVTGCVMLPLFAGMFSLPSGHACRQAAQNYVMHMVSIALWPFAWSIGHTGTIVLYNALISLIAGTSRSPDLAAALQWESLASGAPTEAQLRAMESALGTWFMGNTASLLAILVGGLGFVLWVGSVTVLGPVFLHKLLATGAHFMVQAAGTVGRQAPGAARLGFSAVQVAATGGAGLFAPGAVPGERLAAARASEAFPLSGASVGAPTGDAWASMASAARRVDDSDGKGPAGL